MLLSLMYKYIYFLHFLLACRKESHSYLFRLRPFQYLPTDAHDLTTFWDVFWGSCVCTDNIFRLQLNGCFLTTDLFSKLDTVSYLTSICFLSVGLIYCADQHSSSQWFLNDLLSGLILMSKKNVPLMFAQYCAIKIHCAPEFAA